jgi:hypothetical protein
MGLLSEASSLRDEVRLFHEMRCSETALYKLSSERVTSFRKNLTCFRLRWCVRCSRPNKRENYLIIYKDTRTNETESAGM